MDECKFWGNAAPGTAKPCRKSETERAGIVPAETGPDHGCWMFAQLVPLPSPRHA